MKQVMLTVSALVFITGVAFAETEAPMFDQRQTNQEQMDQSGILQVEQLNRARSQDRLNHSSEQHVNDDGSQGKVRW